MDYDSTYSILENPASETLPPKGQNRQIDSASRRPRLFKPSQTSDTSQPHDFQLFTDVETTPAPPVGPLRKTRKRKAPTLRADAWNPYKKRIIQLHIEQNLSLQEVRNAIEKEFGFAAEYAFPWT
jgi:Clr5 domain